MSLLVGKTAAIAYLDGQKVQLRGGAHQEWKEVDDCVIKHFKENSFEFRLAPLTIKVKGFEIIKPQIKSHESGILEDTLVHIINFGTYGGVEKRRFMELALGTKFWVEESEAKNAFNNLGLILEDADYSDLPF